MNQKSTLFYRNFYTESFLKIYVCKIFLILFATNLALNEFLLRVCTILMSKTFEFPINYWECQIFLENVQKVKFSSYFWSSLKRFGITKINLNFQNIQKIRSWESFHFWLCVIVVWGKNAYKSTTKGQRVEPWHW